MLRSLPLLLLSITVLRGQTVSRRQPRSSMQVREKETTLTTADFENAKKLRSEVKHPKDVLARRTDLFEGDIFLGGRSLKELTGRQPLSDVMRNAIRHLDRKWPDGRIPYAISSIYNERERAIIAEAMSQYHQHTCITFDARKEEDEDYVFITKDDGCYSEVGRGGGRQILSLDDGCVYKGISIHEFMHATGFFHEQSRTDRDDYVEILWNNIIPGADGQFQKYSQRTIQDLGEKYDYGSIMHYGKDAFSRNGQATMVPKDKNADIGQREGFSDADIRKIAKLYNCDGAEPSKPPTTLPPTTTRSPRNRPPTPAPISITFTEPPDGSYNCADSREQCPNMKHACEEDPIVKNACQLTCGVCTPPTKEKSDCIKDDNSKCEEWAEKGYCSRGFLQSFMKRHCCAACIKVA